MSIVGFKNLNIIEKARYYFFSDILSSFLLWCERDNGYSFLLISNKHFIIYWESVIKQNAVC